MRKVLLSAATLFMSMLFGVSAYAADIDKTAAVNTDAAAWGGGWCAAQFAPAITTADGRTALMAEKYEQTAETVDTLLRQTVTGLENGSYTVVLYANALFTSGRGFESSMEDGATDVAFVFANEKNAAITAAITTATEANGEYAIDVEVTDGTLVLGLAKANAGTNWHTIQIKSLTLHTSDDAALASAKAELKAVIDAATAVSPTSEALTAAIAVAQSVYDTSTSIDEVNAAVAPLQAATTLAVNTNAVAGATVTVPVVTNFVVNGTFDSAIAPWQTTTGAQNQALASNQKGAFTGNFFENWNPSNYTGKIYQVIENIPNGLYELSICAFVNIFDATAQYVYANTDKKALVAGEPTAYTVRTTVTDNTIEIGLEQIEAVTEWMGIDNVSLKYFGEVDENYAKDIYASTKAAAEALLGENMSVEAKAALEAALAVEVDETSDEALLAAEATLQEAVTTANASINFYASNKAAIDAMYALMESTNVYTAEAYAAYSAKAEDFLVQYEAGTLTATVDNPATIHGWHASVDYDDLLLSAFGIADDDWNGLHINTWSTEGETDGSDFKVPFFEYWTYDANSLSAATKTATVTGLEPDALYEVKVWVRTRSKNGTSAYEATGITLTVGAGDTVDVTEGAVVGGSQFAHNLYTAMGTSDANGNLTINFTVAADNNVSWLSFKNLKYAAYNPNKALFLEVYTELEMLTETCYTMQMIPAVSGKYYEVQETSWGMKDTLDKVAEDAVVAQIVAMQETAAYVKAMDAKYNEWKTVLFSCYDTQDSITTASPEATAAFAEVVDRHAAYQWSMPATMTAEIDSMIVELNEALVIFEAAATPEVIPPVTPGVSLESPWVGTAIANGLYAYLYNPAAKAFLGAGNSWGTQASFNDGIEWLVEGTGELYTLNGPITNGGEQHYFTGTYTDGNATQLLVRQVGDNVYTLMVDTMYVAYDGTGIVANVTELSGACYWQFVTKEERRNMYATASVTNPTDATFEISGANFGRNDGRNSVWTGDPIIGGDNINCCAEKWNAGVVEVSQVLVNMPSGAYRLSAQGFYRMGSAIAEVAAARANGTEILHAKFFANGDSIPVMSIMEEAGKLEGVGVDYPGFGQAPNRMDEASKFFTAGLYEHSFMFILPEGVDTIKLGVTKTDFVAADWLIFDNFRLEYLGGLNESDYFGNGMLSSVTEGNRYVFYTDAEGKNHFLHAAGINNWAVGDYPTTIAFSAGNITDGFAGAASFMNSNGYYMSNAQNSDGSGAIKTEEVDGINGQGKRIWESQVFYKNAAGKYAIRLTNVAGSSWGANCFVNIDPATLAVVPGQPSLGDALYLWEIADEDDPRFSTQVLDGLIEEAEAIDGKFHRDVKLMLDSVVNMARFATAIEVQALKVQLEEAIAAAKASVAEYEAIAHQLASSTSLLVETAEGYDDFLAVVTAVEDAYNDATATNDMLFALVDATATYLAANEVKGAVVNGTFGDADASLIGWTGAMNTGYHDKWTNVNGGFVERWTGIGTLADFDFYQEISGLPAGVYTFAAYVVACRQSEDDAYEVTGVELYANDGAVALHTINVDRNEANYAIGAELAMVTATIAEGETLTVGMRAMGTDANWVVMDNAKLYSFGAKVDIAPENFIAAYTSLELLTENTPSMWMIPAVNEKYFAVQEPAFAIYESVAETPVDTLIYYTVLIEETIAYVKAMDAKYNEWKAVLFSCYDTQDNITTASPEATAAFAEVVDKHAAYQWSMPATTTTEMDALIVELSDAQATFLAAATPETENAVGHLKKGDIFTYTQADGVEKTYKVVGSNLITNHSFDNGVEGWTGGAGGALGNVEVNYSGGVDGGAYIRPLSNMGKGSNYSIGTAWEIEEGKTYVFSYFARQYYDATAIAKEGYTVTSETNTPRGDETKTIMYAHVDADWAWTQNIVVTTAEFKYLQFCARWLGGRLCFDDFVLAEVAEIPDPKELELALLSCEEWIEVFGDGAKEAEVFYAAVNEGYEVLGAFENFTAGEINAAVAELKEALLDFRVANASAEYPVDVTARYLKNPNFDSGLAEWTRNNDATFGGSNCRFLEYFGESSRIMEIAGQPSVDTYVSQTVYGLPLGCYRFSVQCVMDHYVDPSDPAAKSGVAIYCNGAELDMVTEYITVDGASKEASYPQTFTVESVVTADSIIVGLVGYKENNFAYVAIDNVKLEYVGLDANTSLNDNAMFAQDVVTSSASIVTIPVELENADAITAFQFDMVLPAGVSPVYMVEDGEMIYDITFNSDRARRGHVVSAAQLADGTLRVGAFSVSNELFIGNSGVIVNVAVQVDSISEGDYPILLRNIRMVKEDATEELGADHISILTVQDGLMGDVNSDRQHTMSDVVMMVNAVLEKVQANFDYSVADMNGDGIITMGDVVSVLRLVLGYEPVAAVRSISREMSSVAMEAGSVVAGGNGEFVLPIYMSSGAAYTAFQVDVVLPEDMILAAATLGGRAKSSHNIVWSTLDNGTIRIVAFATDNATFKNTAESLLHLTLKSDAAVADDAVVALTNGLFATAKGAEDRSADVVWRAEDETTGIGALLGGFSISGAEGAVVVESVADATISIYSMTGQLVQQAKLEAGRNSIALPAGVYVINNQKVIVK